jgi:enoyl-CoA hydratase/carnithine racemase
MFPSEVFNNEVLYNVDKSVAVITLNAPDRLNTFSIAMNKGVLAALEMAAGVH